MQERFMQLLRWAARNERHIGAILFVTGFITDLLTFTLLPLNLVNAAFLGYLAMAAVSTFGTHVLPIREGKQPWWRQTLSVLFPFGLQYAIGSILSGFLIFYTKSSVVSISWPFLVLLAAIFIGNEYFRTYKDHLVFQTVLFFFTLYAYAVFALPLYVKSLGPLVFLGSSAASIAAFAVFLFLLRLTNRKRLRAHLAPLILWSAAVVIAVNVSYFTGLIPPIPLTMPEAGIYQSLTRSGDTYTLQREAVHPWWDIVEPTVVHHVVGTSLYAYSAVFAPVAFSTTIVHVWERYDSTRNDWIVASRIPFAISGGRQGGYRGYSIMDNPAAGKWRITIETPSGQAIGRISFVIENASTTPVLHYETR